MSTGDIVTSPMGKRWRVLAVQGEWVRVEHLVEGVVCHFHRDDLTVTEPHPGGPR